MDFSSESLTPYQVIEDIRRGFVDEDGILIKSSANQIAHDALEGYAHDLNAEVAHFLEELIQNFDDAEFDCPKPTVSIEDHGSHLLVSTNEKGMSEANVRAICTIRRGTKTNSLDNIGEKGLGFKTTFKAANSVWIRSGGYSFRLDRKRHLGMAIPIWEDFPSTHSHLINSKKTQFLLEYRDQVRANDVRKALPQFDSKILTFLRQLREINVVLSTGEKRTISRQDFTLYGGRVSELTTFNNGKAEHARFLIQKANATCTPPSEDHKRKSTTSSEVTVAIPLAKENALAFQNAHNFLPIRLTNLKFLINADFKLLQNRADLDSDPENAKWNQDLMQGLARCFIAAIKRMNTHEHTRLLWLRLLPIITVKDSFAPLRSEINSMLWNEPVLRCANGSFARGDRLLLVPRAFRDPNDKLFFEPSGSSRLVLSTIYNACPIGQLTSLRVSVMDKTSFLSCFYRFVAENRGIFREMATEWHAAIAEKLLDHWSHELTRLPIIPLTNGKWIARRDDIFFACSDKASQYDIPFAAGSLGEISFVAKSACLNPSWRRLMTHMGVEPLDKSRVCAKIRDVHDSSTAPTSDTDALLLHATFLFECNATSIRRLWVRNSNNEIVPAYQTYMDDADHEYPISMLFKGRKFEGFILHPSYISAVTDDREKAWLSFLEDDLQVRTSIKLVFGRKNNEVISYELKDLARHHTTEAFLTVLLQNWSQIETLFSRSDVAGLTVPDGSGFLLRNTKVDTQQHGLQMLKDTALPLESLQSLALKNLKLLKIDLSKDKGWEKLKTLGVTCSDNTIGIQLLRLRQAKSASASVDVILSLYKKIQALCVHSDEAKKRTLGLFANDSYIYYPPDKTWHKIEECLWSSMFEFLPQKVLHGHYSECQKLFQEVLKVPDADFDIVLAAVKNFEAPSDRDVQKLCRVLKVLAQQVRASPEKVRKLAQSGCLSKPLVPLIRSGVTVFRSIDSEEHYLLNDRETYEGVFDKACWQVQCTPATARIISDLFSLTGSLATYLRIERRVSACVKQDIVYSGREWPDAEKTGWLLEKFPFIKALATSENSDNHTIKNKLAQLVNVTVHHVDGIQVQPYCEVSPEQKTYGNFRPGAVFIHVDKAKTDQCKLYVDAKLQGVKGQASFFGEIDRQLAGYLGITTPSRKALLREIITADSDSRCIELLRLRGVTITDAMLGRKRDRDLSTTKAESVVKHALGSAVANEAIESPLDTGVGLPNMTTALALRSTISSAAIPMSTSTSTSQLGQALGVFSPGHLAISPQPARISTEKDLQTGIDGELFVYRTLKEAIGDTFDETNWTSELRHLADPKMSPWRRRDSRDYADFTIEKRSDNFLAWLTPFAQKDEVDEIRRSTKFHIEVKTTNGSMTEPFHLSNMQWRQLQSVSQDEQHEDEMYIIIRVYRLSSKPQLRVIIDPFEHCFMGDLSIEGIEGLVCTIDN